MFLVLSLLAPMTKWIEFLANDAYIFFDFFFFTNFPQCVIVASSKSEFKQMGV
jgi:hypothetical protein